MNDKDAASSQDYLSAFHSIPTGSEALITLQRTSYSTYDGKPEAELSEAM